jgi:hypothetical protein
MRHKLALWFLLLLAGFLIGFILQYSRLPRVKQELSASTRAAWGAQACGRLPRR